MLNHAKGNLLDMAEQGDFDVIVQGCNCQNTMGSGIAKEIRERFPQAYEADTIKHREHYHPISLLGDYSSASVFVPNRFLIINAYTQYHYLPRGVDHFEYVSFELILHKLAHIFVGYNWGFPYIGMGLAGGDKDIIMNLLENFTTEVESQHGSVTLVEFA